MEEHMDGVTQLNRESLRLEKAYPDRSQLLVSLRVLSKDPQ